MLNHSDESASRFPRRNFLLSAGVTAAAQLAATSTAAVVAAEPKAENVVFVDCQSHLFFPEVLDAMRKRTVEPLVYAQEGTDILKMGDWLRKIPPFYTSVPAKLAAMDANGIDITMLSTNDPRS